MKANELMTGNWVQGEPWTLAKQGMESNGWLKLTGYGIHQISVGLLNVEPIPLTPELLVKCGFSKSADSFWLHTGHFQINWFEQQHHLSIEVEGQPLGLGHVKHLHQLMNLIKALTGEDLQIEL